MLQEEFGPTSLLEQPHDNLTPDAHPERSLPAAKTDGQKKIDGLLSKIRDGKIFTYWDLPDQYKGEVTNSDELRVIWAELLLKHCSRLEFERDPDVARDDLSNIPENLRNDPVFMEDMSKKLCIPILPYVTPRLQDDFDFVEQEVARFPILKTSPQYARVLKRKKTGQSQ